MIALFQRSRFLGCQLFAVRIQYDQNRQAKTGRVSILLHYVRIVPFIHINQDYEVILLNNL